jgi:hypothetical protein
MPTIVQRPKYSTGFQLMVSGWLVAGLGLFLAAHGAKTPGLVILFIGIVPAGWYRWPSDWEKTWPEDFPILARLTGTRRDPERWTATPTSNWWRTAPPWKRFLMGLLLAGAIGPGLIWVGWPPHGSIRALIVGALSVAIGLYEMVEAWRDLE